MGLYEQFSAVLRTAKDERTVHAFLKHHPFLVSHTFCGCAAMEFCIPEFQFGEYYRTDFLALAACSDLVYPTIVELKSPLAPLFLKDGTPSRPLRIAKRQILDVQVWIEDNQAYLRRSIERVLKKDWARYRMTQFTGTRSHGPSFVPHFPKYLRCDFVIIIGRRGSLDEADADRRAGENRFSREIRLVTYDRLLETAGIWDSICRHQVVT